ncbi:MAG TPA: hypothetical protein VG248_17350 [Caulobacteraceae bacterium]|jgi:hypothetical protein|nr:hypothetical protein [Caulobacteraceae bacterium]
MDTDGMDLSGTADDCANGEARLIEGQLARFGPTDAELRIECLKVAAGAATYGETTFADILENARQAAKFVFDGDAADAG